MAAMNNAKRWLKPFLWFFAILLGALQSWVNRYEVSADGISYLDIGDAYFRGDWSTAINAMWSPLYAWLLGGAMSLFRPTPYWELPVAHLVNFFVYLAALISFNFFLGGVINGRNVELAGGENGYLYLPEWAVLLIGYLIFVWSSLVLIPPTILTPDMCVAAFVYLAAGLLLRIRMEGSIHFFPLLGVALGFGYLAKAPLFMLAFVFLLVSSIMVNNYRKALSRVLLALICFAFVSAPFILALTLTKHRFTFGDSGILNYAWYLNDVPSRHWQGGGIDQGVPAHPTRKVLDTPAIYEFGTPLLATYPVWYDPSYWYEGVKIRFDLRKQLQVIVRHLKFYLSLFSFHGVFLLIGLIAIFLLNGEKWRLGKGICGQWFLLIPAFAALAMYSLVHVEGRYIAPFVVMIILGVISGVTLPKSRKRQRLTIIAICASIIISIGTPTLRASLVAAHKFAEGKTRNDYWLTAEALKKLGVRPGDKIASLGYANSYNARWARLAKIQIVAEMYDDKDVDYFWMADASVKQEVINAFIKTGAELIVATRVPELASTSDWQRLGDRNVYVYFIKPNQEK